MYKEILIGTKEEVEKVIALLNRRVKSASFRFEPMEENPVFYLVIKETEDFEDAAMVRVRANKIYAVSEDAYNFIYEIFEQVL